MKKRPVRSMDYVEVRGAPAKSGAVNWHGNIICWIVFAMVVLFIIIMQLRKDNSQPHAIHIPASQRFSVPDMTDIIRWGYYGQGVKVNVSRLYPGHQKEFVDGFTKYNLNKYLSDRISMRRPLPDARSFECQQLPYDLENIPNVSLVVVFRNEPRTTLLRMLYSVIDRSPLQLVKDIILVDDDSDIEDLKFPRLEHYLSGLKKVIIVRLPFYHGLARARMLGAERAAGETIVFLQPRCECTEGWMLPLLSKVAADLSTIAVPIVDGIDYNTFQYNIQRFDDIKVGSFTWELAAIKRPLLAQAMDETQAVPNPVIADGIFAVNRDFLFKLGGFDEGLMREESVNIEFSFRSWMCGGQIVLEPCSHVGYIFPKMPPQQQRFMDKELVKDSVRIAESLMDGYKHFVYERMQTSTQHEVQQSKSYWSLQELPRPHLNISCQNFDWFLQRVEPSKYFTKKIDRRGRITLFAENKRTMSIGVDDENLVLQDWTTSPQTIWYHLNSGVLITENKTCLSYIPEVVNPDKGLPRKSPLFFKSNEPLQFVKPGWNQTDPNLSKSVQYTDFNQNQLQEDKLLEKMFVQGKNLDQISPKPVKRKLLNFFQPVKPYTQSKLISKRFKIMDADQKAISGHTDSQRINFQDRQEKINNTHILLKSKLQIRLLRSIILQNPDFASLSDKSSLQSQSQSGRFTLNQEQEIQPKDFLAMKPCASENQEQQWTFTETQALQHVKSGLCMEAWDSNFDKYFLRMAKCDGSNWAQQWSFISTLTHD